MPRFYNFGLKAVFSDFDFILFVLVTVIITASGYVINDIFDVATDSVNKADLRIVGKSISINEAKQFYTLLVVTGFLLSVFVGYKTDNLRYLPIYPIAVISLFYYSSNLKKSFLLGNLLVSLFSAGVLGILILVEWKNLMLLKHIDYQNYKLITLIFGMQMLFSFMVSFVREIVKDLEDIEGDKLIFANTLPLKYGKEISKMIVGILSILILILLFLWIKDTINDNRLLLKLYVISAIMLPLFYAVYQLKTAQFKSDFHNISNVLKIIMLSGILMLMFYV